MHNVPEPHPIPRTPVSQPLWLQALGPEGLFAESEPNTFKAAEVESGNVLLTFFNRVIASLEMFRETTA